MRGKINLPLQSIHLVLLLNSSCQKSNVQSEEATPNLQKAYPEVQELHNSE